MGLGMDIPISTPIGTTHVQVPIENVVSSAIDAAWPNLQKKIQTELETSGRAEIDRGLKKADTLGYTLTVLLIGAIVGSAWWVKKG